MRADQKVFFLVFPFVILHVVLCDPLPTGRQVCGSMNYILPQRGTKVNTKAHEGRIKVHKGLTARKLNYLIILHA